ncbi:helix-turn-helix domain-containing protein [Dactylosporangium sp. AC04546]|uniref:GlxA family transcriptional regulator n=1 Tax=Dactylosporangium sp. AC04546 TaxID=2862460 RepID=UPI001EE1103D|nr:helix-turn-helix domain-containing protein [Dactylosporangium sp. AC04546]WVK79478.1 helix-turn-helix domain-containing protein [Dactylosporangium sp. AC04546]
MVTALRVGVLAYQGCFASEVFGVPDLLTMASHIAAADGIRDPCYDVSVLSPRRQVVGAGGAVIAVVPVRRVDVLVVPGFELYPGLDLDATLTALRPEIETIRTSARSGIAVVSICVGAFLLAEAGLLDGRQSTTAWLFAGELARRCPGTDVRPEKLVVTDGGVTTTGAFSAMYDFALGLIREHSGSRVARATARIALVDDARPSQAPYVDLALLPATGRAFSQNVKRRLDRKMCERYDLEQLAGAFHISTRTLLRRFRAETGQTPLEYLHSARVRKAKHLLETTDRTFASIAAEVGYRDSGTFSAVFTRLTGHRPRDYRATFGRNTGRAARPTNPVGAIR